MPKEKPICFICRLPVDTEGAYYVIEDPDGRDIIVHEHAGVEEHGGTRMVKGRPFPKVQN
jgi:hypothetical protein